MLNMKLGNIEGKTKGSVLRQVLQRCLDVHYLRQRENMNSHELASIDCEM
eukprot:c55382_g1_i1 orf=89-238(+)